MQIDVDVRTAEASAFVRTVFSEQLPFATARAINRTAIDFQRAERRHMDDVFTIRRKRFKDLSVKIRREDFATKQKPEATVRIESPGGRSDIFAKFEDQTAKSPFRGRSIAVPTDAVPRTGAGVIRKRWRPSQLLQRGSQRGRGKVFRSRGDVFSGAQGTFLIRRPGGRGTIFRRFQGEVTALYQLVPLVQIEPVLRFERTARTTIQERWAANFLREWNRAVRTAR